MIGSFNNDNFDLKSPIAKLKGYTVMSSVHCLVCKHY